MFYLSLKFKDCASQILLIKNFDSPWLPPPPEKKEVMYFYMGHPFWSVDKNDKFYAF